MLKLLVLADMNDLSWHGGRGRACFCTATSTGTRDQGRRHWRDRGLWLEGDRN